MIDLSKIEIRHEPECYPNTTTPTGMIVARGGILLESKVGYNPAYGMKDIRAHVENNIKRDIWYEVYGDLERRLMALVWDAYKSRTDTFTPTYATIEKIRDGISEMFRETYPISK